jgi:hypothetical protein
MVGKLGGKTVKPYAQSVAKKQSRNYGEYKMATRIRETNYPGGRFPTSDWTIQQWVQNHLRSKDDGYDSANKIEDRLERIEEYLGWLSERAVQGGIVGAEEIVQHFFWANAEVVEVEDA